MMRAALAAVALLFVAAGAGIQNLPQFRSMTTRVGVDVSVLAGNVPVPDLTSADFALTDNKVPQQIEARDPLAFGRRKGQSLAQEHEGGFAEHGKSGDGVPLPRPSTVRGAARAATRTHPRGSPTRCRRPSR